MLPQRCVGFCWLWREWRETCTGLPAPTTAEIPSNIMTWRRNAARSPSRRLGPVHEVVGYEVLGPLTLAARRRQALAVPARHGQTLALLVELRLRTHPQRSLHLLEPELQFTRVGLLFCVGREYGQGAEGDGLSLGQASFVLC